MEVKEMKSEVVQGFKGKINGIEFNDEGNYYSSEFILEQIEDKFGECYTNEFVKELRDTIDSMYRMYKRFSFANLEENFSCSIEKAGKFNELEFLYENGNWQIEKLNEKIAEGAFEKKENLAQTKR